MLENFFKTKKDNSEPENVPNPFKVETEMNYFHKKAILEDGKLYDTETAEKVIEVNKSRTCWSSSYQCRTYFRTVKGNWFSCDTFVEAGVRARMKQEGGLDVKVEITNVTYFGLRLESVSGVKAILGELNIDLYEKYFGEVEEG